MRFDAENFLREELKRKGQKRAAGSRNEFTLAPLPGFDQLRSYG
jgi:hypothetical protein